jgi:UDPglucose 6-dehydrogenase
MLMGAPPFGGTVVNMPQLTRLQVRDSLPTDVNLAAFSSIAPRPLPVTIIGGGGYVGAITAVGMAHLGHNVIAVDIDQERVRQLAAGETPFLEPHLPELLRKTLQAGRLHFVTLNKLADALAETRLIIIAVNTPRRDNGESDLSDIIRVASDLGKTLTHYAVLVLKSTAPVGSHLTIRRVLEQYSLQEGVDYDLVANPEFLREGSALYDFFHPDRVVIGGDRPEAVDAVRELFEPLGAPIVEATFKSAQMIKYAANAYLAARISFINEIANICECVGADIDVVAYGLGLDKRIGQSYLRAGVGFSGPCLPKDLEGLIRLSEDAGYDPHFLKAILEKNDHQRRQLVHKVYSLLGTPLYGRRIAVWGLVFKPGTNDTRDSTARVIIDHLVRRGAEVVSFDPMVTPGCNIPGQVVTSPYDALQDADLLLVLTPWKEFAEVNVERMRQCMRGLNVIDGTNILDAHALERAGFVYVGVGGPSTRSQSAGMADGGSRKIPDRLSRSTDLKTRKQRLEVDSAPEPVASR